MTSVAYMCSRHPLLGGEYYRATRPGALSAWKFGWETAACQQMATAEGDEGGKLSFITPNQTVVTPDIIIVRPIREWRQAWTDQAHENGQFVVADLDDDLWNHEDYDRLAVEQPDYVNEWFWNVDAVLVSTRHLARRVREMGHMAPIYIAPNCYDPFGITPGPRPGKTVGTRLWLHGRMEGDLVMYDKLIYPLLKDMGLQFLHVGAEEGSRFVDRGWDEDVLIERHSVVIPMLSEALKGLSIGTICMDDHPYNDAKTETHAVELAAGGIPLVAASNHPLYRSIPGRVDPTPEAVRERIKSLLDPDIWGKESLKGIRWARDVAKRAETRHMESLLRCVNLLTSESAR